MRRPRQCGSEACHDAPVRAGRPGPEVRPRRRRGAAQSRLRVRHEGARPPEARFRRSLFLPPPRSRGDPHRPQARRRHDLHRAAARRHRGHRRHARRDRPEVRQGDRRPRRRPDQDQEARPRHQEGRAGRELPQAAGRHLQRHPRAADQARRPPAQHAHARAHEAGEPPARLGGDARDLCAAGRPHGHAGHARGAGGAGLQVGQSRRPTRPCSTSSTTSTSATPGWSRRSAPHCKSKLAEAGLKAEVYGREKKPFSIWRKMENRQISLEQLSDIYGFRVVVRDIDACYRVLGVVHATWRAVPGRFKDYISTPKQNNYQSIHTTIVGPRHQRVELQIRTDEMHRVAEYGVAAHALYKDGLARAENGAAPTAARPAPSTRKTPTSGCGGWSTRCSKATTRRSSSSTPSSSCSRIRCSASRPRAA